MINYDVSIGLCVKNSENGLKYVLKNITVLSKIFKKINVIFSYNNSTDNTLYIIEKFKELFENRFNIDIIINNNCNKIKTINLSNARNNILKLIKEKYITNDYFIMMDSNDYSCIGNIEKNIIYEVFNDIMIKKWDSITFDSEDEYYDYWALSYNPFIYSLFHFENYKLVYEKIRSEFNKVLVDYKNNNNDLIDVYSAFNGFAIYKTDKFIDSYYSSNIDLNLFPKEIINKEIDILKQNISSIYIGDCEHRHFHLLSKKLHNSKIKIYPKFVFKKIKK